MTIPSELLTKTFELQYNPNCPKPFLVRLAHPLMAHVSTKDDILGYGTTMEEAARQALYNLWLAEAAIKRCSGTSSNVPGK